MYTHTNDFEYSQVLASLIASACKYDCEYLSVRLRVLVSIFGFSAHKFRLTCGQCIACVRSPTLVFVSHMWYCEWLLRVMQVTHTRVCMQKKFLWRRGESLRSAIENVVCQVSQNRDFFQWGLISSFVIIEIRLYLITIVDSTYRNPGKFSLWKNFRTCQRSWKLNTKNIFNLRIA